MRGKRGLQSLRAIRVLVLVCLVGFPMWANDMGGDTAKPTTQTSRYVFQSDQSTLVQTGGIAGVHWTYSVSGQFPDGHRRLSVGARARICCLVLSGRPGRRSIR
jgi:hypothetical protein